MVDVVTQSLTDYRIHSQTEVDAQVFLMKINGTMGTRILHWTGKDMERELKLYLTTFLVCTLNLFLFVSLEVRALGILKKTVMNARPRIIGENPLPNCVLDASEYSGTIPEIYLAAAWNLVPRQIWGLAVG